MEIKDIFVIVYVILIFLKSRNSMKYWWFILDVMKIDCEVKFIVIVISVLYENVKRWKCFVVFENIC